MKVELEGRTVCLGTGSGGLDSARPAVVFVHGAGFDHSVWVMPSRYFARHGYQVIAPDLPAHGASDGPALTSIPQMAQWLHRLLQSLQISSATVVGHSMGSLVALCFAQAYPEATDKLVLLGASAPMPVGGVLLDAAQDDSPAAFAMANTWSHRHSGGLGASRTPGVSNFVSGARWLQRMQPGVYHADLSACNEHDPQLPDPAPPCCVINGAADKMTPMRAGLALVDALQGQAYVQTASIAGSGHSMLAERPNEVLDVMADFVLGS